MKKKIFIFLMFGFMLLGITGCGKASDDIHSFTGKVVEVTATHIVVEPNEGEQERKSSDKFIVELKDDTTYEVGDSVRITYEGMINESYPAQIGTTKIEKLSNSNLRFRIKRYEHYNTIKYYLYYKHNENDMNNETIERNIFFAGDIEEFYVDAVSLKEYITTSYQTFDDSIKSVTSKIDKFDMLKDGGTTIYKSKDLDLTITVCNTLDGNRDIYFNNYSSEFENTMCK